MSLSTDAGIRALAVRVAERLQGAGRRLVVAESCTGGWVAKACTDLPGSSRWFLGGVVTYSDDLKVELLGVSADALRQQGAVSQAVVRDMAVGALERLGGDVSVAVSGIAGPDGGVAGKPVGTVWFAWAVRHADQLEVRTALERFDGDREAIRRQAVACALGGVLEA
jgi:nicotinamide-nucleotide amidase